jgi:hypothetical protein
LLSAAALAESHVRLGFSRALDPASAGRESHYTLLEIETPAGGITSVPFTVLSATLDADGITVDLETAPLVPGALYELRASAVLTEDLSLSLVSGSRALFRGFQPGPLLALTVPRRPYVPHIDAPLEIAYAAPQGERVLLRVFDVQGRELFVLVDEIAPPGGLRTFLWDGRDDLNQRLPAGVYVLHLEIPGSGDETTAPVVVAAAGEGALR